MTNSINWQQAVNKCHERGEAFVLVTVVGANGSTPREGGSKIVVTAEYTFDSIGGGQLEFMAIQKAREFLAENCAMQKLEHFPLASKAEQCCGGSMTLMFEVFPQAGLKIAVFGAGHVAKATVAILSDCDTRIDWIDTRAEQFPRQVPVNVDIHYDVDPLAFAASLSSDTLVLVLTHDHTLDYQLLTKLLDETEVSYVGLIGSETKAKRFMKRLDHDGFTEIEKARCHCPVGLPEVRGKRPMEVAVSISAQVLSQAPDAGKAPRRGVSWREIKTAIKALSPSNDG